MATKKNAQAAKPVSAWESTSTQYLIRYRPSGLYFAKFKAAGKQFRFSLETTVRTVAGEQRKRIATAGKPTAGRLSFGDAVALYRAQFEADKPEAGLQGGTKRRRCWRSDGRGPG